MLEQNASGAVFNRFDRSSHGQLIRSEHHGFYLFNARGDVVQRVDVQGVILHTYRYDKAFGVEQNPNVNNTNPFRFAGEYYDRETGTIYLRARNYNPRTGRFTQPDPHWNIGNMIFGSDPVRWNERLSDPLGLNTYTLKPDIHAIMQSGNLYVYCINNPIMFIDPSGEAIITTLLVAAAVGAVFSGGFRIRRNMVEGSAWHTGVLRSMLGGGVAGAISVVPIPGVRKFAAATIMGATGNVAGQLVVGEINSVNDVVSALNAGAAAGILGHGAATLMGNAYRSYFKSLTRAQQRASLKRIGTITNRELTAIRQEINRGLTNARLEELVRRYGWEVVVSAVVSSTTTAAQN